MKTKRFDSDWTTFKTSLGTCGLAWERDAVAALELPHERVDGLRGKLAACTGKAKPVDGPPAWVAQLIKRIELHFDGQVQDFSDVIVSVKNATEFQAKVYEAARGISAGELKSYKSIAVAIRRPKAARAVGSALGKNPIPVIIPCHRVVASNKKAGGFSAYGGLATKARLLAAEGVALESYSM